MASTQEIPFDRVTGRVKWFNSKAGYGFITATNGQKMGTDIFVHHSSIVLATEQYKYLVQGEYIEFSMAYTPGATHEYQASDVSGINGGKLMCETRHEFRQNRTEYSSSHSEEPKTPRGSPQTDRGPRSVKPYTENSRIRGSGPREDTNTQYTLIVKKSPTKPYTKPYSQTSSSVQVRPPRPDRTHSA